MSDSLTGLYPHLAQIQTVILDVEDGLLNVIMANFNFDAPLTDAMVSEAVDAIRNQRMCSPSDTAGLVITIIGSVTVAEFADKWHRLVAIDSAMQVFMPMMRIADVLRGTLKGEVLEMASLLAESA